MTIPKTRLLAGALGLLVGPLVLLGVTASPANAAWQTSTNIHGGKLQVCRHTKPDGTKLVRARLNNRNGNHAHRAGLSRDRNGSFASVTFRQSAGNVSGTKSLVYRGGDRFESWVSDVAGPGGGGGLESWRDLVRC